MTIRTQRRKRGEPNVLVLDPTKGFGLTYREDPPGEPLKYRGRWVHLCVPTDDGLIPVTPPDKNIVSPERLYRARYWAEVRAIFGMKRTMMEKIDRVMWLGTLGILAFLVFMLYASLV